MMRYLILCMLPFLLHASKILSYNIYDRSDRVDVMITFDTPYDGTIKQRVDDGTITIKLEGTSIESSKIKQLPSKYIKSVTITPMQGYTQIVAEVPPSITLQASKTSDAYGLRLRFATSIPPTLQEQKEVQNPLSNTLPTKKEDDISLSYYIVVTLLILGIIALFIIKKRVALAPLQKKQQSASWLFKEEMPTTHKDVEKQMNASNVAIRFQKPLDGENSVVMLDFANQSYLVLMGKGNIILDKFTENIPTSQDDFNSILQSRHKELENFLNSDKPAKEPLQAYKEKAASILYEA